MFYVRLFAANLWFLLTWMLIRRRLERGQLPYDVPWKDDGSDAGGYLLISLYDWEGIRHRPHHLTAGLAREGRVVYFRPLYLKEALEKGKSIAWKPRLTEVEPKVYLLEATFPSGENQFPSLIGFNNGLMVDLLKLTLGDPSQWRLIVNDPKKASVAAALPCASKVYDILDNYEAFSWATSDYPAHEREMLSHVDLVIAGTHEIYEKKSQVHDNVHFMGCGVDAEHFSRALVDGTALPEDIRDLPKPILFYMGVVDERIDKNLILELAQDFPDGSIVLAGPVIGDFATLEGLPEVHLLGLRPYADLPRYLKAADVCLIPFKLNEITRHINPTKLLEYMAAGRPVVSINIPDVVKFYGENVLIAADHDEFVAKVHEALGENGQRLASKNQEIARDHSWERFTNRYISFITTGASS